MIDEVLEACKEYDEVLVFAGLTDYAESEGADREHMRLPENQLALIDALIEAGKGITVILYGGSPVELPFAERVDSILNMYLPGQNGGEATYSLLFGEASPSGRLAETWPLEYADVPFGGSFGKTRNEVYKESIFVGYRYYTTANKRVRYPFGYGLSYTSFTYENMSVQATEDGYLVSCDVTNTGAYDGTEVVQLYVGMTESALYRPLRELKGFTKIYLKAGETGRAEISVTRDSLCVWETERAHFALEGGVYRFELCSNCEKVMLSKAVAVEGERVCVTYDKDVLDVYKIADLEKVTDGIFEKMSGVKIPEIPSKTPIRMESRFSDMKATPMGKILYAAVMSVAQADMRKAKKMPEGAELYIYFYWNTTSRSRSFFLFFFCVLWHKALLSFALYFVALGYRSRSESNSGERFSLGFHSFATCAFSVVCIESSLETGSTFALCLSQISANSQM